MGPLHGVKVVDLSVMISGPWAAMMLADQGAEVIKVESPGLGDVMRFLGSSKGGMTGIFIGNNRGKRSLVVDLKHADGLDIVSLNQPLAWDLPCNAKTREKVLRHAAATMLGTVTLVERTEEAPARKVADVMLRYNFPGNGLSDEALRTLILMVLATGADLRADLAK